jgi:hypothetical protein
MTPTAVTPAGRGPGAQAPAGTRTGAKSPAGTRTGAKSPAGTRTGAKAATGTQTAAKAPAARTAGHPGEVRKRTGPQAPRRVSGPLRRGRTHAAPWKAPARGARASAVATPLVERAASFVRALPDHAWLDRIIRGRAWIPLLGVMLAGIVAMQVEVLKLSASMGRSLERSTALQSRNEILRASVAGLADDQRIERIAAGMGLMMAAPDAVAFLAAQKTAGVQSALAGIHQPNAAAFTALLPATVSGVASSAAPAAPGSAPAPGTALATSSSTGSPSTASAAQVLGSGSGASSQAATTPPTTNPPAATAAPPTTSSPTPAGQPSSSSGQAGTSGGTAPVGG